MEHLLIVSVVNVVGFIFTCIFPWHVFVVPMGAVCINNDFVVMMMMMVVMMMRKTIQRDWKENMHTKVVRQCLQACK